MLFLVRNYDLVRDREKTYLTASVAVAGTTLTVKGVDSNAWADNDWIIVGEIGTDTAEILQINGAVSDGTSLTVDNAGSGGARFAHSADEPVYRIDYNQIEFSRATTATGSKSVLTTNEIQVDDIETRYEDTANSTGFGFVRFKNSLTNVYSNYSDAIPYTGYTAKSLGRMMRMVRKNLRNPSVAKVDDQDIIDELNEAQRDVAHERLWPFYEIERSASRVANQKRYAIDDNIVVGKDHGVVVDSQPMAKVDSQRFDILHWDSNTLGEPSHAMVWDNAIELWPTPDTSASSSTLNDADDINSTDTTIVLDDASAFRAPGRAIIDSEVFSYEAIESGTDLVGCRRGLEGTTAASHTDGATVTERDIIYRGHEEPTDLVDLSDTTSIPDPSILVFRATAELAVSKLTDQELHDRYLIKYGNAMTRLKNKFGRKSTLHMSRIKDKDEVVRDRGAWHNPNDYPLDIG